MTFGKWTLIDGPMAQEEFDRIKWRWLCRCACGRKVHVLESNLLHGVSRQCKSCAARERAQGRPAGHALRSAAGTLRNRMQELPDGLLQELQQLVTDELARRAG
ncbi:MAG: hypothetical protein RLZZ32_1776 [Cyanobacteriota bacterium]|jgi:hypothetical protein